MMLETNPRLTSTICNESASTGVSKEAPRSAANNPRSSKLEGRVLVASLGSFSVVASTGEGRLHRLVLVLLEWLSKGDKAVAIEEALSCRHDRMTIVGGFVDKVNM